MKSYFSFLLLVSSKCYQQKQAKISHITAKTLLDITMPDETINEKLSCYNHGMIWKLNIVENSDMMYFLMIVRYVLSTIKSLSQLI